MGEHPDIYDEFAKACNVSREEARRRLHRQWAEDVANEDGGGVGEWIKAIERQQRGRRDMTEAVKRLGVKICPLHRALMGSEYSACLESACAIWDECEKCCSLFRGIK